MATTHHMDADAPSVLTVQSKDGTPIAVWRRRWACSFSSRVVVLQGQGHAGLRTAPKMVAAEILRVLQSDVS
jgi:hypothetical protein